MLILHLWQVFVQTMEMRLPIFLHLLFQQQTSNILLPIIGNLVMVLLLMRRRLYQPVLHQQLSIPTVQQEIILLS